MRRGEHDGPHSLKKAAVQTLLPTGRRVRRRELGLDRAEAEHVYLGVINLEEEVELPGVLPVDVLEDHAVGIGVGVVDGVAAELRDETTGPVSSSFGAVVYQKSTRDGPLSLSLLSLGANVFW
jgi:hypothetical protein